MPEFPPRAAPTAARSWRRLVGARAGNVGVIIALAVPALAMLTLGATDLAAIMGDRARLRSIAEAAALAGARNLSVAMGQADSREHARAMAQGMIDAWRGAPEISIGVEIVDLPSRAKGLRVRLDARRPSFFGDLLPPGGWRYGDAATASALGSKPLCVLAFSSAQKDRLYMRDAPEIRAPECLVHSNGDVEVRGGQIEAGQTEAVRSASGDIRPEAITDAPPIKDPFADLQIDANGLCLNRKMRLQVGVMLTGKRTLQPGVHCGAITLGGDAELVLAPGEHRFQLGTFLVGGDARLTGDDVVLVFDKTALFKFTGNARVSLTGRKSGTHAGFVAMAARGNTARFEIDSTKVDRLDGVIYVPDAELLVSGQSDVARQSDWTVIVANRLRLTGNPNLYLNADYDHGDMLVPAGVGDRRDAVRLVE